VTAFYGIFDASSKTLSYTNAGHNPPLLLDAQGNSKFLDRGNIPLGIFHDTRYHEYYLTLEPDDLFVLYTDGVTEAANLEGEEFGRTRLAESVKAARHLSANQVIASVQRDVLAWTQGQGATDDITFFVIKALP
jgi:sigma-B regulation protein RsbU (phosphoserine phosphatase)